MGLWSLFILVYKKTLDINENTPVLLYGYGGFNIQYYPV